MLCDFYDLNLCIELNEKLRKKNKGLIISVCSGLFGFVFTDFGDHLIYDKNGEPLKHVLISGIEKNGIVYSEEEKRHDLEKGDLV